MWFIFRPDAANVWENSKVVERYSRYKGILDGKKIARYLITKKIPVEISETDSLEKLWIEHDKIGKKYIEIISQIDNGNLMIQELETPKISFLDLKEKIAWKMLRECHFCERRCKINRFDGKHGFCRLGKESFISSAFLHTGEESVLVPSGTIFFTGCTFTCVFCQNHDISQEWCYEKNGNISGGVEASPKKVVLLAERLWREGARNINLVGGDPTPNTHTIISALKEFDKNITILWNSNMYQSLETTKLLLELMDFWLPDFKFWENDFAKRMSGINHYREIVTRNIEMAYREGSGEILIRHLIMPGRVEKDTFPILEWCAKTIPQSMVNLMDQYHPDYLVQKKGNEYRDIDRRITSKEWQQATFKADELKILWKPVS
ncbi:MAG: radical SAM protein [Candidatus Heimdallarchaeota archaeon]|nr:radical SAM protein [Candidatus Heimdallarchaeota archaeon]